MRLLVDVSVARMSITALCLCVLSGVVTLAPPQIYAQGYSDGDSVAEQDELAGTVPEADAGRRLPPAGSSKTEEYFRAANKRLTFSIANIFTSRDIWRGIDWFVDDDPAYLIGGEMVIDLTPYDDQAKRDIWELKLYNMIGGAYSLKSGHEIRDRWKVTTSLQNRFFKYIDLDIGYEHYGLPPFDDHDRDFDELIIRTGINAIPTFKPLSLPGFKKPVTEIPFGVHYGAYYASSSKSFSWTSDKFGFHGYPAGDWWWHEVAFDLIVPLPDVVPENTFGIVRGLKLDSVIWVIDNENALPGLPSGIQDVEFGLALPLFFDIGKKLKLERYLWGAFEQSQLTVIPNIRYAIDAQNLDMNTGRWNDEDEIFGGVVLLYSF